MGMKRELRCKAWAAPATVSGEPAHQKPLGPDGESQRSWEGGAHKALTREPGDLPVVVVLRPDGVRRAKRVFPE